MMAHSEDIDEQLALLAAHRRTLAAYLKRKAILSTAHLPPEVTNGITEARYEIRRIKAVLISWGVHVDEHPDDKTSERDLTAEHSFIQRRRVAWLLLIGAVTVAVISTLWTTRNVFFLLSPTPILASPIIIIATPTIPIATPKAYSQYYATGTELLAKNDINGAISEFTKAVELNPESSDAYNWLGLAYYRRGNKGDDDLAIKNFSESIKLANDNSYALIVRGIIYSYNKQDYPKAIDDFTLAMQFRVNEADLYCERGHAYRLSHQKNNATDDLKKCLSLSQNEYDTNMAQKELLLLDKTP